MDQAQRMQQLVDPNSHSFVDLGADNPGRFGSIVFSINDAPCRPGGPGMPSIKGRFPRMPVTTKSRNQG